MDLAARPLRSVRAAGIPRPLAVEVIEVVSLSDMLPVMAVAIRCVWAAHCIHAPEPSLVHDSAPETSPVHKFVLSPVKSKSPFLSLVKAKSLLLSLVKSKRPFLSLVKHKSPFLSQV